MRDLTQGSIAGHLLSMSAFMAVGLIVQTLYFLIDLYFVSGLGAAAIAGVSAAGNVSFLSMALTQVIAVGAISLVSQAIGRKDGRYANLVAAQSLSAALVCAGVALVLGYAFARDLVSIVAADEATTELGVQYLHGYLPSLALMFPTVALGASLRASGVVQPGMWVQSGTLALNALLAPVLITGWLTGAPLGVFGAGLASSIAVAAGLVVMGWMFHRVQSYLAIDGRRLLPRMDVWRSLFTIGLPSALEFFLMFLSTAIIYYVIRDFGAEAQAGFGIGARVMQSIFLPAMAIAFAATPIAGQNYGAKDYARVRSTFRHTAILGAALMATLSLLCHWRPDLLIAPFTDDPEVLAVGSEYIIIASWNFVAIGLVFACSGMFQALGDTRPTIATSLLRLLTFALPALWLSGQAGVALADFWRLGVASIWVQAGLSLYLLGRVFRARLGAAKPRAAI